MQWCDSYSRSCRNRSDFYKEASWRDFLALGNQHHGVPEPHRRTTMTQPIKHPNAHAPALYRFNAYCALIGASPETICKEVAAGRAPLRIVTLGERGDRYVTRETGDAYLAQLKGVAA